VGGVVRDGEWLRVVVGDEQRVWSGRDIYGARGGAEPCDGDADGDVGD
jgi:hypothetical protein